MKLVRATPPLRRGWTTGACATAAAKAAYTALLTGDFPNPVSIALPRGERPWSSAHVLPPAATASSARGPPNTKEEVNTDPTDRDAEPLDPDQ